MGVSVEGPGSGGGGGGEGAGAGGMGGRRRGSRQRRRCGGGECGDGGGGSCLRKLSVIPIILSARTHVSEKHPTIVTLRPGFFNPDDANQQKTKSPQPANLGKDLTKHHVAYRDARDHERAIEGQAHNSYPPCRVAI
eukprot:scaffold85850_cov70-Phaeocystis_antarctica.AAC.1